MFGDFADNLHLVFKLCYSTMNSTERRENTMKRTTINDKLNRKKNSYKTRSTEDLEEMLTGEGGFLHRQNYSFNTSEEAVDIPLGLSTSW